MEYINWLIAIVITGATKYQSVRPFILLQQFHVLHCYNPSWTSWHYTAEPLEGSPWLWEPLAYIAREGQYPSDIAEGHIVYKFMNKLCSKTFSVETWEKIR